MKIYYLGIDVSKKKLDCCLLHNGQNIQTATIVNKREAIILWISSVLSEHNIAKDHLVICAEHTGQYTYPLICAAKSEQLYLSLEDAAKIKYSNGIPRGKNDKVDAHRIALYAERYNDCIKPYQPSETDILQLKRLSTERSLLTGDKAKYQAQLTDQQDYMPEPIYTDKYNRLRQIIEVLENAISEIDEAVNSIICYSPVLSHQMQLLMSIDGIGERTALKMIIETEAFTTFDNPRKFCCHAGVAPFAYISGSSQRSKNRVSNRADKSIKTLLHMAALSVCHLKGTPLQEYYERKVNEGKNKMSVINAIRAKLVNIMFAVIRTNSFFSRNYLHSLA